MLKLLTEQKRSWIQQQLDCWSEMVLGRQLAHSFIAIKHQQPPFLVHRSYSGDYWLPQAISIGHTLTLFLGPGAKIYDNVLDITYSNSVKQKWIFHFVSCTKPKCIDCVQQSASRVHLSQSWLIYCAPWSFNASQPAPSRHPEHF